MLRRTQINKELCDWIAKPVRSHRQIMRYCERLELWLSMKELPNGYKFKSCETAINVVNAQTESERQLPFSTEQAHLDMARLLSQMDRKIELGNDIDLNLLLTRLGNIFPQQDDPADDNSLQAAPSHMLRSSSTGMSRRHNKSTWGTTSIIGANVSKMLETLTLANHLPWVAFTGHSTTSSPKWEASRRSRIYAKGSYTSTKKRQYASAGKENGQEPMPRFQRQEKCAAAATKAKTKEKTSRPSKSFVPVRQERSSEGHCEAMDESC
jgi:hypothetical protein